MCVPVKYKYKVTERGVGELIDVWTNSLVPTPYGLSMWKTSEQDITNMIKWAESDRRISSPMCDGVTDCLAQALYAASTQFKTSDPDSVEIPDLLVNWKKIRDNFPDKSLKIPGQTVFTTELVFLNALEPSFFPFQPIL